MSCSLSKVILVRSFHCLEYPQFAPEHELQKNVRAIAQEDFQHGTRNSKMV